MLRSHDLLRIALPAARTGRPGAAATAVGDALRDGVGLSGVPARTVGAFCDAFEAFVVASMDASLPTIYGRAFLESLACNLFGRDPLLTLLSPQIPNRRILLVGERGTGKERIAGVLRAGLQALSGQSASVAVNAAALPETLLESTLFGHVKGAFTGATAERTGLMRALHPGGVLFFDEAAEASAALQAKLLRVFQTGEFAPVGAPGRAERADFHVVAATNAPLDALLEGQAMRADLVDRLAAPLIEVPPLRSLLTDPARGRAILECVAVRVIRDLGAEGRGGAAPTAIVRRDGEERSVDFELWATPRAARIARAVESETRGYPWPGNLREAAQMIRQSLFVGGGALRPRGTGWTPLRDGEIALRVPENLPLRDQLEAVESALYRRAARDAESIVELADRLGVARQTAARRMRQLGVALGDAPTLPSDSPRPSPTDSAVSAPAFSPFTRERLGRRLAELIQAQPPAIGDLRRHIDEHMGRLREAVSEHRYVDPSLAARIATALLALVDDLGDAPAEPHARLVAAAVAYFIEVDDDDHDLLSAVGLDDDVRVVNEVAALLGREDVTVTLE